MTRMERHRIQMAERKQEKKARLKAQAGLRRKQSIEGLSWTRRITADNAKSEHTTYSEEIDARQETAKDYLKVLQRGLPGLLIRLSKVEDYRNPKKIKHKVAAIHDRYKPIGRYLSKTYQRLHSLQEISELSYRQICKYGWQFMIVLKDDSLPCVCEEFNALKSFDDNRNNRHSRKWGNRRQRFIWVNDICHIYDQMRKEEIVHVVVCEEEWEEVCENARIITQHKKFAWISSEPLNRWNLHQRCNLGGRSRWVIENGGFLVEKRHGYQYEHTFSFNRNDMKGFHVLMRIGHLINVLAQHSNLLRSHCIKKGLRSFIKFMDETSRLVRLNLAWIRNCLAENYQVRYF